MATTALKHTDLYGTWTVLVPLLDGDPGPGFKHRSKFRITHDLATGKHVLEKLQGIRWNKSGDPIELTASGPNEDGFLFFSADVGVLSKDGSRVHDPGKLVIQSDDGVNLIVKVEDVGPSATGHTGSGTAGRP